MLPKLNRIRKQKEFESIFKKSKSLKSPFFIIRVAENKLGLSRYAFVVSQKVSPRATVRNKTRRRLSEIIRPNVKSIAKGINLLVIALPGIDKREFSEIKDALHKSLVKLGLIDRATKYV